MSIEFIDYSAPSLQGKLPKSPQDLPHGLLVPPQKVLELIERERLKHPPAIFAKNEEQLLNQWTLQYYFDYLGYEVIYRHTVAGPEVHAVGDEEQLALRRQVGEEAYRNYKCWMP
jgi:hypothetical protein